MAQQTGEAQVDRPDVGPDPVWPLGMFIFGLLVMCFAGAFTWHWWFMIGEGFLLVGVVWFLTAVAITRLKQDPVDWRTKLPRFLGGTGEEEPPKPKRKRNEPAAEQPRKKKKKKKRSKKSRRKRQESGNGERGPS